MTYINHYDSPLGAITISSDGENITGLWFDGQKYFGSTLSKPSEEIALPVFTSAKAWLDSYFLGENPDRMPPVLTRGSPFCETVWGILRTIPYGETRTYAQIAAQIARREGNRRMSAQAVGGAVGRNPISLMIPCHRVIGSNGSLTGYAGGMEKKLQLLKLEHAWTNTMFIPQKQRNAGFTACDA